ncbi:hypothetical protein CRE_30491 [Caenorhabditis remanei]|nr:hypothetical protein CRE_30491 [Caenorhabditis remanei]
MPRGFTYTEKKRGMGNFKKSKPVITTEKYDICGKKASQSMRSALKPTDQCHTRQLPKFTPRRKHIAYKAPLPCKIPTYKPTIPKKSFKPSTSDDWLQKRSQHRAQLRQRA